VRNLEAIFGGTLRSLTRLSAKAEIVNIYIHNALNICMHAYHTGRMGPSRHFLFGVCVESALIASSERLS
jgi:hypothetical protein